MWNKFYIKTLNILYKSDIILEGWHCMYLFVTLFWKNCICLLMTLFVFGSIWWCYGRFLFICDSVFISEVVSVGSYRGRHRHHRGWDGASDVRPADSGGDRGADGGGSTASTGAPPPGECQVSLIPVTACCSLHLYNTEDMQEMMRIWKCLLVMNIFHIKKQFMSI